MKSILLVAALAASSVPGLDVHLTTGHAPHPSCAQRLVGKQVLGVGTVAKADNTPNADGKYLVHIEKREAGQNSSVDMWLTTEQLCDLADSVESASR